MYVSNRLYDEETVCQYVSGVASAVFSEWEAFFGRIGETYLVLIFQ